MKENKGIVCLVFSALFLALLVLSVNVCPCKAFSPRTDDAYYQEEADSEYEESGEEMDIHGDEYVEEDYSEEDHSQEYEDETEDRGEDDDRAPWDEDVDEEPLPEESYEEEPPPGLYDDEDETGDGSMS